DIGTTKKHFGMRTKSRFGGFQIIFGADGQNDPGLLELLGISLYGKIGLASRASLSNNDTLQPVVAKHAAPQSVVKIEDEAFLGQPVLSRQDASDKIAVEWGRLWGDLQLALKPAPRIEPRLYSVPFADAGYIEKQYSILGCGFA